MIRALVPVALLGALALPSTALAGRFVFEEEVIVGEVQKPEVTLTISRENLNKAYDFELKESFLPKIVEALEKPPF